MENTGQAEAAAPAQESALPDRQKTCAGPETDALQESLCLLDNSQSLIRTIFLGLALQYRSLDLQRCLLEWQAENPEAPFCGPQPREMQTAASLITLCALFGFQRQAECLACQQLQSEGQADMMDVKLSALIILISLIRLVRLNIPPQENAKQEPAQQGNLAELEETEELSSEAEL